MRGALDLATGYAAERKQYGRPVGSFQAVQHLLADALVATEGSPQRDPPRRLGGRRPPAGRRAGRRRGRQGLVRPRRPHGVRDLHPGPRRDRQHVGVPGPRPPAPGPAVHRRARRDRSEPGAGARAPRDRSLTWTSVTRPTRPPSGRGCASGWPSNNPGLDASSTSDDYWHGQADWHHALYDAGFFGLSWPTDIGGQDLPERLRRDPRRRAGRRRRAASPQPRLPRAGHPRARQRRHPPALPARHRQRARPLVPGLQRARRRLRPGLAAHPRRARRRRLRHQRPQGLDLATPTSPTGASCWPAPTTTSRSTRGSPPSPSRWTSPASSSGRCG